MSVRSLEVLLKGELMWWRAGLKKGVDKLSGV
jgi:hypothetical protein